MTVAAPPRELLELREAVSVPVADDDGSLFAEDGTIPIHVIRPGIGRGRGRHLYEAEMLQEHADKFAGWKMYVDHLAPEARKAAGGLPRSVRDLGGRVTEAKWDPAVPADPDNGFGPGAVVARVKPVRWLREMIEDDPELVEASISAQATGVRPVTRDGQKVWLVEGIADRGSVDWVTEGGAGGRVAPVLEAAFASEEDVEMALLESMSDDEVVEYLRAERPHLSLEEGGGRGPSKEEPNPEGGEDMTITPEALREALQTPESVDSLREIVESMLDEERDIIRAEARADAQREVALARLEVQAHRQIEESKLPDRWREDIRDRFRLLENGQPTPGLNVVDEVDDDGNVTKAAAAVLSEAVQEEIKKQRELLREAGVTRVRGQGAATDDGDQPPKHRPAKDTSWGSYLQEAAGIDPDDAYSIQGAGEPDKPAGGDED